MLFIAITKYLRKSCHKILEGLILSNMLLFFSVALCTVWLKTPSIQWNFYVLIELFCFMFITLLRKCWNYSYKCMLISTNSYSSSNHPFCYELWYIKLCLFYWLKEFYLDNEFTWVMLRFSLIKIMNCYILLENFSCWCFFWRWYYVVFSHDNVCIRLCMLSLFAHIKNCLLVH